LDGPANIVRLHGQGEVTAFDQPGFADLLAHFPGFDRARAVVTAKITRISDSCGWGIPFYDYRGDRDQLRRYVDNKPEDEWRGRRYASNATSIDGLPGLDRPK